MDFACKFTLVLGAFTYISADYQLQRLKDFQESILLFRSMQQQQQHVALRQRSFTAGLSDGDRRVSTISVRRRLGTHINLLGDSSTIVVAAVASSSAAAARSIPELGRIQLCNVAAQSPRLWLLQAQQIPPYWSSSFRTCGKLASQSVTVTVADDDGGGGGNCDQLASGRWGHRDRFISTLIRKWWPMAIPAFYRSPQVNIARFLVAHVNSNPRRSCEHKLVCNYVRIYFDSQHNSVRPSF